MTKHLLIVGHGLNRNGTVDSGALSQSGITEHSLNNDVARMVKEEAQKVGEKIDVFNKYNVYDYNNFADVVLGYDTVTEIHFNAFNGSAHGTEILIYEGYEPDDMDKRLLNELSKHFFNRGFNKRPYSGPNRIHHVSRAHDLGVNYRLVEVCFIDNENDLRIYQARKKEIARGIASAILNKEIKNTEPQPEKKLYRVQVGAFTNFQNAQNMVKELEKKGFKGSIIR